LRAMVAGTDGRAELRDDSAKDIREYCTGADKAPGTDEEGRVEMKAGGYTDAEIDALDDELVFARNRNWIPQLEALFKDKNVVVVVGADHLRGDKGVLSMMRAKGYTVTRVLP
jgi:uncharacterized protein YbaP (TraB family)